MSARTRLLSVLDELCDGLAALVCSKQVLLDIPDPGGAAVEFTLAGADRWAGSIIAAADICVTEAVAAMTLAAQAGISIRVIAIVDITALDSDQGTMAELSRNEPAIGVVWCAPRIVEGLLWSAAGRIFPIHGYCEKTGATPWETLQANEMDRHSILSSLCSAIGVKIADPPAGDSSCVTPPVFTPPDLCVRSLSYATSALEGTRGK
jgi:xylulose-5-phosphate/fructose-6-phosphate phosphoketolase